MKKRTALLRFDKKTAEKIRERDGGCLFCRLRYETECTSSLLLEIKDIMHVIPKSQGGLGVEQNGVYGCRHHHGLLDNGNKGLRAEMLEIMEEYLRGQYPGWEKGEWIYKK